MNSNKIAVIGAIVIAGGMISLALLSVPKQSSNSVAEGSNVSVIDGKQIVEIVAQGGYTPRKSVAKAGLPTIVRFKTDGAFDCSSSVRIQSLNISRQLARTGNTDIDIGTQSSGTLRGSCSMGMYPFEISFQ